MILSSQNEPPKGEGSFWEDKIMQYDTGKNWVFYHRYHLVWSTKYRYKVLPGGVRFWVRGIVRQVCGENRVDIIRGVLSCDHVHMCVSVPPKLAVSDLLRKMKGRCLKWSGEFGQHAKMYPTQTTGYVNDQETQVF
jgi:REP-associated tyrosine transposase